MLTFKSTFYCFYNFSILEALGDASLMEIAENMGKKWKKVAIFLGFTWDQIHNFQTSEGTVQDAVFAMLMAWKQRSESGDVLEMKRQLEEAREKANLSQSEIWKLKEKSEHELQRNIKLKFSILATSK